MLTGNQAAISGGSRVGILFVASSLFSEAAAEELIGRTRDLVAEGELAGRFKLAGRLARDRASCAAALESIDLGDLDGLVIQLSTFCTADLLHEVLSAIGERALPLAVWALEESDAIITNSLCGAQLWASTLARFGRRFTLLMGNPGDADLARDLAAFAAAARANTRVRGARVALIGSHADWFTNLAVDPWALKRALGVTIEQMTLVRFLDGCKATAEAEQAAATRWAEASFDGGEAEAGRATLGRTYARLEAGLDAIKADAVALRDWPEILYAEDFRGTWAALGELSERAIPIAPEGDVMGAVSALVARAFDPASLPFLTDISGIDRANNRLVLWHYGVSPRLADGPRSLDPVLKQETFPLRPGPMTLFRLSMRADGSLRIFVAEGAIEDQRSAANRAAGYFRPWAGKAEALVRQFIDEGYEHHVTAVYGHWGDAVAHLGRQLGVKVDHA
ncbi:hypothetical protein [Chelatococcus asaccharovorans]|uniref:hypothetical protein n=1 Tax=Chelatococcus asaccharovorans TaxID=28210 RepID=UPI00224C736F|nr:hypothetical protein [Chelatococcus asaccharovorans]CAH1656781.1 L-fucose isomerase-like protein [Chelatococcus asaccharovorans]CAH1684991.1 L-fucose isomerase-like protein [Chelatococcus asaccharovorans]